MLLAYGCPVQAIVKAFGFDERTIRNWWQRAGVHCQNVHEAVVASQTLDLQQVQADEIKVKVQGGGGLDGPGNHGVHTSLARWGD